MIEVVPFNRRYRRTDFRCGMDDLDTWLQRYAGQSENRDTTRTFLALDSDTQDVTGYYATRTYELDLDEAAAAFGVGKRKYPLPAVLLARLAVDHGAQGQGIGKVLLVDAMERVASVSAAVGFEVLVVDAINMDASTFYRRFGFVPFQDDPLHLYITTRHLRETFAADA